MDPIPAGPWDAISALTVAALHKACDPASWADSVSALMAAHAVPLPSPELSHLLASHLGHRNTSPFAWKYAERAIAANLAPAMLLIALVSLRIIPSRTAKPMEYRLYLELIKRHAFSFPTQVKEPNFKRMMTSINDVLQLSERFGTKGCGPWLIVIEYVFSILCQLLDATLEDEGLQELTLGKKDKCGTGTQDMEIDGEDKFHIRRTVHNEKLRKVNSKIAVELIWLFLQNKVTSRLLSLVHENMPVQWRTFIQRLQLLVTKSSALCNTTISMQKFQQLIDCNSKISRESKLGHHRDLCIHIASESLTSSGSYRHELSNSSMWIPIDLYLEDCIGGSIAATSAVEILCGLVKSLQAVNRSTWHDAFLSLWMASLRLVQRERDPLEGPVPHLDTRLCLLLSITTLSVAAIIEEDEVNLTDEAEIINDWKGNTVGGSCRKDLITSVQSLGDYESLLSPPSCVVSAANQAAAKAMMFVSGVTVSNGYLPSFNVNDKTINCNGNMWHLIVEACIARNLIDTSAYFWPGYINGCINQMPHTVSNQLPSWSSFMNGAPLSSTMVNALVATPALSLAELEKIFEIATNGSDDDKVSAAAVLCGATLLRGWNIQEHTVRLVVELLSPSIHDDFAKNESHWIRIGPMLNVILTGISCVDCAQVFSFHGLVPELAGALMAICEVFGSFIPSVSWKNSLDEEITAYTVFSNAFILLLRLWKFNHPPLESYILGDGAPVGSQLNPEYLLLFRNARVSTVGSVNKKRNSVQNLKTSSSSSEPIFVDSFPKLKTWYRQHQACLASTLSGLIHGTPVHQNVDSLLNMMFRKVSRSCNDSTSPRTSGGSGLSNSSMPASDDSSIRPKLPAWDIMEAVPFVVDAALTACSHGKLSPRELATGLKDLADFLPATLATIVSYFSAEVTRGVWKPASMNGTDWPSPAANLSTVEEHIKKIVAATGVDVPSLVAVGSSEATLPLPLAAFVSFTITYKLDKASERFLNLAGPALENLAASCPWPSMPIVAALWTQKVKRWTDFLVFSASRTVFQHNNDAVVQLLKSCFSADLGLSSSLLSSNGGVGSLLGHGYGSHFSGGFSPVAPGILYLRIYRCIKDNMVLTEEILSLLMDSVKEVAERVSSKDRLHKVSKLKHGATYAQLSLAAARTRVKVGAALGATFVWLSGGLSLVQSLIYEILPSWFLSVHDFDQVGNGAIVYTLSGYALAYFVVLAGMFAWGAEPTVSKRRLKVVAFHMEFLASALDGNISLGCDLALWHAYVSGFLGLVVECAPSWVLEVDSCVLKKLSRGLMRWNEHDLALSLLRKGGIEAMGTAAEVILTTE